MRITASMVWLVRLSAGVPAEVSITSHCFNRLSERSGIESASKKLWNIRVRILLGL